MPNKALVVDANILVRAVLGKRGREVIETYAEGVTFFVPEVALAEAEEHLPALVIKHGGDPEKSARIPAHPGTFGGSDRKRRLRGVRSRSAGTARETRSRGLADSGHGIAAWLSHMDRRHGFFGCGVATWTSSTVQTYLRDHQK